MWAGGPQHKQQQHKHISHCIRLDYALASPGLISSIEHLCYDHTFAASDHCPMLVDLSKSLFPTSDATPSDGTKLKSKAPKQKGISSFFKMAK
jgi:hypothetical protein